MKALVITNYTDDKFSLSQDYVRMLEANNILPITVTNLNLLHIEEYVSMCDIILITGGGDIDPSFYLEELEESAKESTEIVPVKRDIFEIRLVKEAIKQKKKILGICRGMQVINVALGGTLYQNMENHMKTNHIIKIREKSTLSSFFESKHIEVNSVHHQAVKTLGEGLIATAVSKGDNFIEAIEGTNILGVQWHMERLKNNYGLVTTFLNK